MTTYYKAVRPDGGSFHDPAFRWLPEDGQIPDGGWLVEHPDPAADYSTMSAARASRYLSVSTEPADCTGFQWPCRLLIVEAVGPVQEDGQYPHKRRGRAFRVVGEVEAWRALGPNGRQVAAFLALLPSLSPEQRAAARDAAWDAAWDATRAATRAAAWTARALVVRDLISAEHFATLTAPMRAAGINFDTLGEDL